MVNLSCEEAQVLLAIQALQELRPQDSLALDAHLATCPDCRLVKEEDATVLHYLSLSVPQTAPPSELKAKLLRRIESLEVRPSFVGSISPQQKGQKLWNLVTPRVSFALALAGIVLAVALGTWAFLLQIRVSALEKDNRELRRLVAELPKIEQQNLTLAKAIKDQRLALYVATSPAAVVKTIDAVVDESKAWGMFMASPTRKVAVVMATGLKPLPADKAYQVWLIDGNGNKQSAGTFTVDQDGYGQVSVRFEKPLEALQGIGVSVEPSGGSAWPTGARVLGGDF